ncbi:MAG: phosphoribosyl-AMP cyclohydrolase [Pseudomonadota bacterium]|nr:phosphoribosyl-AMP cyclohydrolase [Pseudomonadota bacterium]
MTELPAVTFGERRSVEEVEEGTVLAPRFDERGLIACVTTDHASGDVLMLGYMNQQALQLTIQTGEAHYWSRTRQALWHKGAHSGLIHHVREMRIDDDQDTIWLQVSIPLSGASCHVGYHSCFYRRIPLADERRQGEALIYTEKTRRFDPQDVYAGLPNPTLL